MYHDKQAAIIMEHANQSAMQQAAHSISLSHPDLEITVIKDLRQILNKERNNTHTQRYLSFN